MTTTMAGPALKVKNVNLQDRVSHNIRVLLAIREITQRDLAKAMGLAAPSLSQKFTGRTRWNMDDIEKASGFLNVKPEAIVAGSGFEPETSGL